MYVYSLYNQQQQQQHLNIENHVILYRIYHLYFMY